jgi:sulfide:quinone oxidoreductase
VEFGAGLTARVDVDFLSGPKPTSAFHAASTDLAAEKVAFGSSRLQRWFGA